MSIQKTDSQQGLDINDVRKIAHLARLDIDERDLQTYASQLTRVLGFVQQLNEVDTTDITPMAHPLDMPQRLRPDVVTEKDQRELFQSIAPLVEGGLYLVPRVVE